MIFAIIRWSLMCRLGAVTFNILSIYILVSDVFRCFRVDHIQLAVKKIFIFICVTKEKKEPQSATRSHVSSRIRKRKMASASKYDNSLAPT